MYLCTHMCKPECVTAHRNTYMHPPERTHIYIYTEHAACHGLEVCATEVGVVPLGEDRQLGLSRHGVKGEKKERKKGRKKERKMGRRMPPSTLFRDI